jgi:uncharacterized protein (TIGR03435 family)
MVRGDFSALAISMSDFAKALGIARPVIDKTGVKGLYDFHLTWTPDATSGGDLIGSTTPATPPSSDVDPSAASIFTAIQEQLGLKLDSSKGPVPVTVIDNVEKPQKNQVR